MDNTNKLRPKELFYMIIVTVPPLLMLFIPNYANIYLGIDAWWIFALIAVIDIVFAYFIVRIGIMAPQRTVVGMCRYAFGEALGSVLAALFVLLYAFKSFVYFRQTLEYVFMSTYTPEPVTYYVVPMVILVVLAQFYRFNTILRLSNIVFGVMVATYVILMISAMRNFEVENLMPVLVDGASPVLKALIHFFTWTGNAVVLLMCFHRTTMKTGVMKYVMLGCTVAYGIVLVLNVMFIGVFGIISGFMTTSVFELSIFFNGKAYFNNFDSIIKLIWIFGTFIRDSIFISCAAESLAEFFKIERDSRIIKIALPLAIAITSTLLIRNDEVYFMIAMGVSSILCAVVQYGGVLALWMGLKVKTKAEAESKEDAA